MKKSVPWNLIIPKLKQEISADEERQLETWLRSSNNEALFKELQLLWEKSSGKCRKLHAQYRILLE